MLRRTREHSAWHSAGAPGRHGAPPQSSSLPPPPPPRCPQPVATSLSTTYRPPYRGSGWPRTKGHWPPRPNSVTNLGPADSKLTEKTAESSFWITSTIDGALGSIAKCAHVCVYVIFIPSRNIITFRLAQIYSVN